jgi:hypothetical protein
MGFELRTLLMKIVLQCAACTVILCVAARAFAADGEFKPLFNGTDLTGWVQQGGTAKYTIEGDVIVGTAVPNTSNTFLCTERHYRDFELEVDFKVSKELNSGIQIRSNAFSAPAVLAVTDESGAAKERNVSPGRVHGYQVEIDPSDRAYSGGVYDEGRRGYFLQDLSQNEAARKAFKQGEWNTFRIKCEGDHIQTWINGVAAADFHDSMTPSGFIALQVHGIGDRNPDPPLQVRWRNIKLREIAK